MRSQTTPFPDPRFSSLQEKLLPIDEGLSHLSEELRARPHAAVSLVLRNEKELELLLIRRAVSEGDPWSGQMALPGGRHDPSDPDLLHTAIRETEEETGVSLDRVGFPIGRLDPMTPATQRLPPILIFPHVFGVPRGTQAEIASREVDEVLWVPLSSLQDPAAASIVEISYKDGTSRAFPCFRVGGRVVWGLTYRLLTGFIEILEAVAPPR